MRRSCFTALRGVASPTLVVARHFVSLPTKSASPAAEDEKEQSTTPTQQDVPLTGRIELWDPVSRYGRISVAGADGSTSKQYYIAGAHSFETVLPTTLKLHGATVTFTPVDVTADAPPAEDDSQPAPRNRIVR